MTTEFEGKVALLTGAGHRRGFGRAIALQLAAQGADIVVADICRASEAAPDYKMAGWEELRAVAAEVEALGRRVLPVKVDVTKASEVEAMAEQAMRHFGQIDLLVNCAGVLLPFAPVVDTPETTWDLTFDVNCKGTFLVCKYVVPHMIKGGKGGKIVNLASQAGKKGQANLASYAASKAAVISLTQSLALELAYHKINANAVCPGIIETDMGSRNFEDYLRMSRRLKTVEEVRNVLLSLIPLRRFGSVDEVAKLVGFLLSSQADYLTGQAINLSGGQTMD